MIDEEYDESDGGSADGEGAFDSEEEDDTVVDATGKRRPQREGALSSATSPLTR